METQSGEFEFSGSQHDNSCHICYRDMENFSPRKGVVKDGRKANYKQGLGICPEHNVSYSAVSMRPDERGNCSCGKNDCPVCGDE